MQIHNPNLPTQSANTLDLGECVPRKLVYPAYTATMRSLLLPFLLLAPLGDSQRSPTTLLLENQGFDILANGGDGYGYSDSYWTTSYEWCRRSVTINLTSALNMTQMALGENLTEITASEIVRSPSDGTVDYFYLLVELRNSSGGVVAAYRKGSVDEPAIVASDDDK